MDEGSTRRLDAIQAARGIAASMVVAYHALFIEKKYLGDASILPEFFSFGLTGVDLFFVISGFVMVYTTQGRHGDGVEVARFGWNRFARIYPTYWFYYFILLGVFLVAPSLIGASQGNQFDLLRSFLLLPDNRLPLLLVAWSLVHEVWFYVVFAVLLALPARMLVPALVLWAAIIVGSNMAFESPASAFLRVALHAFTLEFVIGCFAGLAFRLRWFRELASPTYLVMLATGIVVLVSAHHYRLADGSDVIHAIPLARVAVLGFGFGLIVLALSGLERHTRLFQRAVVRVPGDISYSLYLSHVLVLSAAGRLTAMAAGGGAIPAAVLFAYWVFVIALVYLCAWLAWRFVERPLQRLAAGFGRRMFGASRRPLPAAPDGEPRGVARPVSG